MAKATSADAGAQTEAKALYNEAREAMAEMKDQLAAAKKDVAVLFPDKTYDPDNREDMKEAKARYQASLKVHVLDSPDSPGAKDLMKRMYGLYEKVFPIAEEREEYDKLLSLMGKNHDKALQASGAPFREQWILLEDDKGEIVAARNVITFSAAKEAEVAKGIDGTQHLIYGFVEPRVRSLGLGDFTMKIAEDEARKFVASTMPGRDEKSIDLIQISEQNAPLKMSMSSMLTDTAGAKTDQFWRREYYESLGFRELGFDYIQLPLEPREDGGQPTDELNLIIRGVPAPNSTRGIEKQMTHVSADSVRFHLYNFFDRSVAAGQYEVEADPDWIKQAEHLHGTLQVKPKLDFMALKEKTWDVVGKFVEGKKFNADDFENKSLAEMTGTKEIPPQVKAAAPAASKLDAAPKASAGR